MHQILLYYKYTTIEDPEKFCQEQKALCKKLKLTGRIIIAKEGINGTVEGLLENMQKYIRILTENTRFADIHFKKSEGTGNAFPKLSIKVRNEIVSAHLGKLDVNPARISGKYITPEQLHEWIKKGEKFYICDMRNDYEHDVGYFKDSILAPFTNFRDLPKVLPALKKIKGEKIVTVCTGGVRCEKASGFLVQNGFDNVYQLHGGIVSYMEKYPNEDFMGQLYVFDGRVTMGFNLDSPKHMVVGKCAFCYKAAEAYYDCANIHCKSKRHFVSCHSCLQKHHGLCTVCFQEI